MILARKVDKNESTGNDFFWPCGGIFLFVCLAWFFVCVMFFCLFVFFHCLLFFFSPPQIHMQHPSGQLIN